MEKYEKPVMEVELFDENEVETTEDIFTSGDLGSAFSDQKPC